MIFERFCRNRSVKKQAIIDAGRGKPQADDSIMALIGRRPTYEPQNNPTHLAWSRAINPVERTELEDDLRHVQSDLAESPSLLGMTMIGALLFVVEVLGALLIMKALGLQNPERTVYAIALASSLFFLTSRLARAQESSRKIWFPILLGFYAALVIGIAAVRLDSTAGDEFESRSFSWGSTIVMLATTIVPAFFFERIWVTRVPVAVLNIGEFNRNSTTYKVVPHYVDPVPGRAVALAERATAMGIQADWMEGRVEQCLPALRQHQHQPMTPLLLNIDRPRELATAIRQSRGLPVLAYMMMRTPNGELLGIRVVIEADDDEGREMAATFFGQLGEVTARRGHNAIFGERGEASHMVNEPLYRAWFAKHAEENLPKVISGLEPDSALIELTADGVTTLPMQVHNSRETGWAEPTDLAREVAESGAPLLRGEDFVVAEQGPDGVRLHLARVRKTDKALAVKPLGVSAPP
jgi:hypothetical protein